MANQVNRTVIGIFILGAITLVIAAVLILGSGKFLKKRPAFVMYFDESVKGLMVGSPVVFKGVQIGSVTKILLYADLENMNLLIPVIAEFDAQKVRLIGDNTMPGRNIQKLIERGLKGQLQNQSYLTGQLMINLDLFPDKPLRLMGNYDDIPEIPTIPTTLEEISRSLEGFPWRETLDRLQSVIDGLEKFVNSPELTQTVQSLSKVTRNAEDLISTAEKLLSSVENQVEPISNSIQGTLGNYKKLARNIDKQINPLADNIDGTLEEIGVVVREAEETLRELKGLVAEDSITPMELRKALREVSAAARSIRVWADYLESHPEALIWGKGK